MNYTTLLLLVVSLLTATSALAQDSVPSQAPIEITVIPGGATIFQEGRDLLIVRSEEFVPDPLVRTRQPFFGTETRFGHRLFGGLILKID